MSADLGLGEFVPCYGVARAEDAPSTAVARVPVHIVNGRLVVACQLSAGKRIAVNLFLDYDAKCGLILHNRAAQGIEAEAADGTPHKITIHLPDLNIEVAQRELGAEEFYERFTKWYSKELGENAIVGTLGSAVLSRYHLTFDLNAGFVEFERIHPATGKPPEPVAGSTTLPLTEFNDLVWCPVGLTGGQGGIGRAIAIATSTYDTLIDTPLADELAHPAGDVGPVRLGDIDLSKYVAFRPEAVHQKHPDGVFGSMGLNFLEHFRVEVDRVNRFVRFTESKPASFPTADLEFFQARASDDEHALAAWVEKYKTERLAPEAAQLLLDRRLDSNAPTESIRTALEALAATRPADLKATGALESMQQMSQAGKFEWALAAAELGLAHGREDRYPDAVHKLHARMGSILLDRGERREAWKHLLSAAFGLPDDGPLNLDLGRCYEQEGRFSRAYSRYLLALLSPDSGPAAIEGLERVQSKLDDGESFSVDSIERMIEGKIEGFGAATKFQPEDGKPPTRAVLVEYYTNANFEGEAGVVLARDGLRDHFGDSNAVLITYDVEKPALDPLMNPFSTFMFETYAGKDLAHVADGTRGLPVGARTRFKQQVFDSCRGTIEGRLGEPGNFVFAMQAHADAKGIRGQVTLKPIATSPIDPSEAHDLVVQVLLVERGVLYPGKSKVVVHRNVARAALTSSMEGVAYDPATAKEGTTTIEFDRDFASIVAANNAYLDDLAKKGKGQTSRLAVRIDPRQVRVVAILRRVTDGEVFAAAQLDPDLDEALR